MKTLMLLLALTVLVRAEDWTVNGKTYQNVRVTQVDADVVHVNYDGGMGRIKIADLPPELQKKFAFDPVAAKAASDKEEADRQAAIADLKTRPEPAPIDVSTTKAAPPPPSSVPSPYKATIAQQIDALNQDIADKGKILREEHGYKSTGGSYASDIANDQAQIAILRRQLTATR